jgi:DNA-directed RNA polymerase specialized sigma24 family protein
MDELERLYRERYARFRDGLAPVTGSYDTAHDVVQDAFATAFVRRRSSTWAMSAASHALTRKSPLRHRTVAARLAQAQERDRGRPRVLKPARELARAGVGHPNASSVRVPQVCDDFSTEPGPVQRV